MSEEKEKKPKTAKPLPDKPEEEDTRKITIPYKEWLEWKVDKEIARRKKEKEEQEAEEEPEEIEEEPEEKTSFSLSDLT